MFVEQPLQPLMKTHALSVMIGKAGDSRRLKIAVILWPFTPSLPEFLNEHAERCELRQRLTLIVAKSFKACIAAKTCPEKFESPHFDLEHGIAIDATLVIKLLANDGKSLKVRQQCSGTRDFLDAKVKRVEESAAAGKIGARLLRYDW